MPEAHSIAQNVARVRQRIATAARGAGRDPDGVTLVAVTKYVGLEAIRQLVAAGCLDLGESRPQQLWQRAAELGNPAVRWHLIGHLQRNKVARTLDCASLIHSADSVPLIEACGTAAVAAGKVARLLLEVNISGDPAKHGFQPGELANLLPAIGQVAGVEIRGLMAMAGLDCGPDETRRQFAAVRQLRDALRKAAPSQLRFDELSLGMSGDFEIAIAEGATIVRVGSALFEGLDP